MLMQRNKFYFSGGPYQQILQGLHDSLSTPEAFIKLMGPAHAGKSTLCDKLAQYMRRKDYQVVHFDYAIESPDMLRTMLARELDLPNLTNFARVLEDALIDKTDKPLILIFDDSHLLTDITLIEIYRLAEIQVGTQRMLNIVLCGDTSLERRLLSNAEFKSLLLQVSHKFYLEPMDAETLSMFFVAYLEKAGMPGLQLDSTAMSYFYKSCKGFPEPATTLCRLMIDARLGKTELLPITKEELAHLIKSASADENLPTTGFRDNNQIMVLAPVFAVIAIASLGFLYQQLNTEANLDSENALTAERGETDSVFTIEEAVEEAITDNSESISEENRQTNTEPVSATVASTNSAINPQATDAEPVSDSSLALVTAAERGVAVAEIVEPEYESLVSDTVDLAAENEDANEAVRRVITLDADASNDDSAIVLSPTGALEQLAATLVPAVTEESIALKMFLLVWRKRVLRMLQPIKRRLLKN